MRSVMMCVAFLVGGCGGGNSGASKSVEVPRAFAQCAACHSMEPGRRGIGPSLTNVVGKKAGSATGYNYSSALASSGLTWDVATLDRFLANPAGTVPGTRMVVSVRAKADREAIIAYLSHADAK